MSAVITCNNYLKEIIKQSINSFGPMSFARFMKLALYEQSYGYYQNTLPTFGYEGDFVTAPMLGNLFAKCVSRQIEQVLSLCEPDKELSIVEIGAGNGQLALDILIQLETHKIAFDTYYIYETSKHLIGNQKDKLKDFHHKVMWLDSWKPEQKINGVIIANEVADALPVYKILLEDNQLWEIRVTCTNDEFNWIKAPLNKRLDNKIKSIISLSSLPNRYYFEFNYLLEPWFINVMDKINQGCSIIFDYGFPREELYHEQRNQGTIMCHSKHTNHDDVFSNIGQQDITSHIDFTTLKDATKKTNSIFAGYSSLAGFLIDTGIDSMIASDLSEIALAKLQSELFTLISPAEMGELFKVFAATKKLSSDLVGFSRNDRGL